MSRRPPIARRRPGSRSIPRLSLIAAGFCLVGVTPFARGQNRPLDRAEETRRQVLGEDGPAGGRQGVAEPERETQGEADSTRFGVDLQSIRIIAHQDDATPSAAPGPEPVAIAEDVPTPAGLEERLLPFVGRPVSMALLQEISREIVLAWRESEHPLVDVYFPEQNVTGGRLQVVAREAVFGEKEVNGARLSRENYLLEQLRIESGDRINRRRVESDLDWLNENPARQVDLIYERGEADGTSDIVLEVDEEDPFEAYTGFANTGVELTGEQEWSFGFNWNNPFRREHVVGYHFATDLDWDDLRAHSVFYEAFLPWRHSLRLVGVHVSSESEAGNRLGIEGESEQVSAEYRIPLQRPGFDRDWRHDLVFAFDYKSTNTDLLFGGTNVFATDPAVGQFRAAYEFAVSDDLGRTRVTAGVVGAPGNLYDDNDDASFARARAGSTADYWYGFAEVERLFRLPRDFALRLETTAQFTGDRLNATEQLLAGGYNTVRGFDESLVRGDSGALASLELISPPFSLPHLGTGAGPGASETKDAGSGKQPAAPERGRDTWNAFLFYDAAALDISEAFPGEVSPSLHGAGIGLNCRLGERGFARASYGWALDSHGVPADRREDGRFHFGITITY